MPPVTPTHWRGVRLANHFGAVCPQRLPLLSVPQSNGPTFVSSTDSFAFAASSATSSAGFVSSPPSYPSSSAASSLSSSSGQSRSSILMQSTSGSTDRRLPDQRLTAIKRLIPFLRNQSEDCLNLNLYVPFTFNSSKSIEFVFVIPLCFHLWFSPIKTNSICALPTTVV